MSAPPSDLYVKTEEDEALCSASDVTSGKWETRSLVDNASFQSPNSSVEAWRK